MKKYFPLTLLCLLASCSVNVVPTTLIHKLPKSNQNVALDSDLCKRTASKIISRLKPYISTSTEEDYVLSPASYILAYAGTSAVSEKLPDSELGITNPSNDVVSFLSAWNYEYKNDKLEYKGYTLFKSSVLHQSIGNKYEFDIGKRYNISDSRYISSMESNLTSYRKDATAFFKSQMGMDLEVPNLNIDSDSVVTYGALKMKDYVPNGLTTANKPFNFKNGVDNVDSYLFGSDNNPKDVMYCKGNNYSAFKVTIAQTSLLIVLPDASVDLNNVDILDAYDNFINNATSTPAYGYIPYFHNVSLAVDVSKSLTELMTGEEVFMSKILKDDVVNDLSLSRVIQSSDFEFNKNGVAGESITAMVMCGSSAPGQNPINLSVDRPFYAFSLKDNFPLFINKVVNPGK